MSPHITQLFLQRLQVVITFQAIFFDRGLPIENAAKGKCATIQIRFVDRTTDGTGFVKDMTLGQLRELSAGTKWAPASQLRKLSAGITYSSEFKKEKLPLQKPRNQPPR